MYWQRVVYFLIFLIVVVTITVRFVEYKVQKDFQIFTYGECDPTLYSCFVYDCTLDADPECDPSPYKKMTLQAATTPNCILENDCDEFECEGTQGCESIFCSDDDLEEGESCVSGVMYVEDAINLNQDYPTSEDLIETETETGVAVDEQASTSTLEQEL